MKLPLLFAAMLLFMLAGCGGATMTVTVSRPATASSATTSTSTSKANNVASVGQSLVLTDPNGLNVTVTVVSVKDYAAPTGDIGQPPQNGQYAVADISIQVGSGQYAFNTLYFKYQAADGETYDASDGNAATAGYQPSLGSGTLSAGQDTRGDVTFDVPANGGRDIQVTDPLGAVVGQWNLDSGSRPSNTTTPPVTRSTPVLATASSLTTLATRLGHTIYWAGEMPGYVLALQQASDGSVYLRYLAPGTPLTDSSQTWLSVVSYPEANAYGLAQAGAKRPGAYSHYLANGGLAVSPPNRPTNVFLSHPGATVLVEVFDPSPGTALHDVLTGLIRPIG